MLDDFLSQAEFLVSDGCHVPSASLAGAVLEDTMRKMCDRRKITYPSKTNIEFLNTSLVANKTYDKLVQKQITAYADIRNNADHGHFEKVLQPDVKEFLRWLRRFVSENLGE